MAARRTSRSTSRWSRSRDRRDERRGRRERTGRARRRRETRPRPLGLTEAALEALLFVAERPLAPARDRRPRRGRPRRPSTRGSATSRSACAAAGIRLVASGDRVELATAPEAGALIARYVGADAYAAVAGGARDPGDRRLPPAGDAGGDRADPRRRLRLHDPRLLHRRLIVELGRAETPGRPYPVRHRLRVPGALRADQPRRPAAARRRGRRPARRGRPGAAAAGLDDDGGRPRPTTGSTGSSRRTPIAGPARVMAAERLQKVLAAAGVASRREAEALDRGGPGDGRRAGRHARRAVDPAARCIAVDGQPVGEAAALVHLVAPQAGRRDLDRPRPPRRADGPRPRARGAAPEAGAALPGRAARPRFGGPAAAHQRRRVGRARAPPAATASSASTRSGCEPPLGPDQAAALEAGIRARRGAGRRSATCGRRPASRLARLVGRCRSAPAGRARLVPGDARARAGSASSAGCSRRSARRSSGWSGSASGRSGSARCRTGAVRPLSAAEVRSLGAGRVSRPDGRQRARRGGARTTDPTTGRGRAPAGRRHRRAGVARQEQRRCRRRRATSATASATPACSTAPLTWLALRRGRRLGDAAALVPLVAEVELAADARRPPGRVLVDGVDVTAEVRRPRSTGSCQRGLARARGPGRAAGPPAGSRRARAGSSWPAATSARSCCPTPT